MTETKTLKGFIYKDDFLTTDEELLLLDWIYKQTWNTSLARRTQHYGHVYQYKYASSNPTSAEPVPDFLIQLFEKVVSSGLGQPLVNESNPVNLQVIINEYTAGQGIFAHIDDPSQFGKWIVGISLGSHTVMNFSNGHSHTLRRCSIYEMRDYARYSVKHSIPPRKTDPLIGARSTRISITFRHKN